MDVKISQLQKLLYKYMIKKKPFFIHGAMGIGKSDSVRVVAKQVAAEKKMEFTEGKIDEKKFTLIDCRVSQLDPSDLRGIPFPEGATTKWLRPNWLPTTGRGVIFFDELNLAPPSIQASCFKGETLIAGEITKHIKDLVVGDLVMDMNGNMQEVTELKSREYNGDIFEIKGRHLLPIEATTEHPFYVIKKYQRGNEKHNKKQKISSPEWVTAKDLKVGDYISTPILQPNREDKEILVEQDGDVKTTIKLTDEFARFLGYYVGDGYGSRMSRIGICLGKHETDYQEEVKELIQKVFGATPLLKKSNGIKSKNMVDVGFNNIKMVRMLKRICGNDTYTKKIPNEILYNKDNELLRNFLIGYFKADGHQYNEGGDKDFIGYSTVNKTLALQVQQAFTRFGLLVGIAKQKPSDCLIRGKIAHFKEAYKMQSSQKEIFDILGINKAKVVKRKTEHFFKYGGQLWAKIDKIKRDNYKGNVYNCEVENTHSYLANNYIVHNCYQLILDRRLGDYMLPEDWTIIAAGNRAIDKANVFPMAAPLKNRFSHAHLTVPTEEEWREWAMEHSISSDIIAFMAFKPTLLFKFNATSKDDAFPTPRCVSPDTDVMMWDGSTKKIKNIKLGDEIVGYNKNGVVKSIVKCKFTKKIEKIYTISDGINTIRCSGEHKFLTDRGFVEAKHLSSGIPIYISGECNNDSTDIQKLDETRIRTIKGNIPREGIKANSIHNAKTTLFDNVKSEQIASGKKETRMVQGNTKSLCNRPCVSCGDDRRRGEFLSGSQEGENGAAEILRTTAINSKHKSTVQRLVQNVGGSYISGGQKPQKELAGQIHNKATRASYNQSDRRPLTLSEVEETCCFISQGIHNRKTETTKRCKSKNKEDSSNKEDGGVDMFNPKNKFEKQKRIISIGIEDNEEVFYDLTTTSHNYVANNFITHNSWALASNMIEGEEDVDDQFVIVSTCVGEAAALEYQGFIRLKKKINIADILKNPEKVKEINDVGLKYSLISGLAEKYRGDRKMLNPTLAVIEHMDAEFGVFLLRLLRGTQPKHFTDDLMGAKNWEKLFKRFNRFIL